MAVVWDVSCGWGDTCVCRAAQSRDTGTPFLILVLGQNPHF